MYMSKVQRLCSFAAALVLLGTASLAAAQGVQIGTISGSVRSSDQQALPGVTVTATSPSLQGESFAVSDANGVYSLQGLPAGSYTVSFVLSGFQSATREAIAVREGGVASVDALMSVATVTETVTVTAEAPTPLASATTSQTFAKRDIDALPAGRRPFDVAELSPGVTTNPANASQLTMSGGFGYDNVFMVNGVDVNDNVFGTSNNLFIEDAVQETAVLTNGISAEYGRFSGGVVNVVTKSGGNSFSGSFREGLSNPKWIAETPLEKAGPVRHADLLSKTHEGTFGGAIVRDRLWFFTAGRYETANTPNTFAQNGASYTRTDTNKRGELKLTGTVAQGQRVEASFINNATSQVNATAVGAAALLDSGTLTNRELPNRLFVTNYNGALSPMLFATMQYSQKQQGFRHNGGTSTDIRQSPFRTAGASAGVPGGLFYNAPYLDATDPEDRNNQQITGTLTTLMAKPGFGSHELKGGAEYFVSTGIGGNSQSSTGSVFIADYLTSNGSVVRDAGGQPIPVFTPGVTEVWNFLATRGAEVNIKTTSLFVHDRWISTPRLTLDLGARFENVRSSATGDINAVNASTIMPRLAASYDLLGDGKTVVFGTYGHYSGKYSQVQFAVNTNVGRPSEVDYVYSGPAGQGLDFAPGFDLANYQDVTYANFPTANIRMADDLQSPVTREFTAGVGRQLGANGDVKATYAWRTASQFVEDFVDTTTGTTDVPLVGVIGNRLYANTDDLYRDYQALVLQSGYRVKSRLMVNGHYTLQLRNHGNFSGEAANQPGIPSVYGNYPEIFGPALDRLMPEGRLDSYQQHKLRVGTIYTQPVGRFGSLDIAPLWRVNSGGVYSLSTALRVPAQQLARNPGYPVNDVNTAVRETVFFGDRGGYDFKGYGVMDFAGTFTASTWKTVQPWFKVEVYNVLNNLKQIAWDRTISVDPASALDANGIPTGYVKGPRFGQATSGAHFVQPYAGQNGGRTVRMAFGIRF
jgi:outer membrane receptor for ferrienterochelin and colicin